MSKIRASAKNEACQVRIIGVCSGDNSKTIWSHARWHYAGRAKSLKAPDIAGAYCCTDCDAVYDGQRKPPAGMTRDQVDQDWSAGHFRSLLILRDKKII